MKKHWPILVVDDEEVMCESMAAWLREDGYRVDTAPDGQKALELEVQHPESAYNLALHRWRSGRLTEEAVVQQLLEKRTDLEVNCKGEHDRMPLSYEAAHGHEAAVRLLLEKVIGWRVRCLTHFPRGGLATLDQELHQLDSEYKF